MGEKSTRTHTIPTSDGSTTETKRWEVFELFERNKNTYCYKKYLSGNHMSIIPESGPSTYRRLQLGAGIIPPTYYAIISQSGQRFSLGVIV